MAVVGLPIFFDNPRIYEWKLLYPVSFRVLDMWSACFTSLLSSKESKWIQYLSIFASISILIGKLPISERQPMLVAFLYWYSKKSFTKCKYVFSILWFFFMFSLREYYVEWTIKRVGLLFYPIFKPSEVHRSNHPPPLPPTRQLLEHNFLRLVFLLLFLAKYIKNVLRMKEWSALGWIRSYQKQYNCLHWVL